MCEFKICDLYLCNAQRKVLNTTCKDTMAAKDANTNEQTLKNYDLNTQLSLWRMTRRNGINQNKAVLTLKGASEQSVVEGNQTTDGKSFHYLQITNNIYHPSFVVAPPSNHKMRMNYLHFPLVH